MKKVFLFLLLSVTVMTIGCKPKDHHATPVSDNFVVPEVADIVMYQVNPRVFAPENSFQAIIERIDFDDLPENRHGRRIDFRVSFL